MQCGRITKNYNHFRLRIIKIPNKSPTGFYRNTAQYKQCSAPSTCQFEMNERKWNEEQQQAVCTSSGNSSWRRIVFRQDSCCLVNVSLRYGTHKHSSTSMYVCMHACMSAYFGWGFNLFFYIFLNAFSLIRQINLSSLINFTLCFTLQRLYFSFEFNLPLFVGNYKNSQLCAAHVPSCLNLWRVGGNGQKENALNFPENK